MKKIILISIVLIFKASGILCQTVEIMKEISKTETENNDFKIDRTYYFLENLIDSAILVRDSITLYKIKINPEFSRIELYNDSKFCFIYNIKFSNITKEDDQTGERTVLTIQNSDEIFGKYGLAQVSGTENEVKDKSIRFILKDGSTYDFDIIDRNNQIILVKR